jgi:REP element-mobilizing transposase RayT
MPRKTFLPSSEFPYHVRARCINKEWFAVPIEEVWDIFSNYLHFIHHGFDVKIHSFVLMNNHFHLIVSTPSGNLNSAMNYLMRETSRMISKRAGRINQTYGGPYNWSLLKNSNYYIHCYKYVYRNPVEAGLVSLVESYPYSTLRGLLGFEHTIIPIENDVLLFNCVETQLEWLNRPYPSEEIKADIRNATRKREFRFALDKSQRPHQLETSLV